MMTFLYILEVSALGVGLVIFSYLDRIYRELGRVNTGRVRQHLEVFEAEIEPHIGLERTRATTGFRLLANLWLVLVTAETARGVIVFVPGTWDALVQALVYVLVEVLLLSQFIPDFLLARTKGRWLVRLALIIRAFLWIVWPFRVVLELASSVARISDDQHPDGAAGQEEGIGALVDAAEQGGILDPGEAQMIEQVVEFSDKRVLEFMTPRPEVIAIPGSATVADLRRVLINTKFSRIPVYEGSLDDITGIAFARDLLQIPESEAASRTVRELARPAFFVPETKHGSDLLKEMQRRNQQMAIVVDEHGSVAGIVTVEDLVEEIIGEIGEDDRVPTPDAVRETDGSLILRGSVSVEKVQELFGVEWDVSGEESATTIGGLLNHIAGHVPAAGEHLDYGGLRFEVLEANQRKVLRLRARRLPAAVIAN
ncbi:MAG TPA: hemolysin family protein [Candidatus Acidoferrales bacterium]|jgi:CBS domain containing-hemolysin-like protein|nr:hemolysin family protein [Candidatus Acidoferrales bacterium]